MSSQTGKWGFQIVESVKKIKVCSDRDSRQVKRKTFKVFSDGFSDSEKCEKIKVFSYRDFRQVKRKKFKVFSDRDFRQVKRGSQIVVNIKKSIFVLGFQTGKT